MDYDLTRAVLAAFDFDGIEVSVVTPAMLYRVKKDAVRARDRGDAERLKQRFGLEDE